MLTLIFSRITWPANFDSTNVHAYRFCTLGRNLRSTVTFSRGWGATANIPTINLENL